MTSSGTHAWFYAASGSAGGSVSLTQAMTLDASGNLILNNPSPGAFIDKNMWCAVPSSGYTATLHATGTASGTVYAYFSYAANGIGTITQNGTTGVLYNTTSDYRLKENTAKITNGVATINQLNPITFDWIADKSNDAGFLAHEFQAVLPRSVTGAKDAVDAKGNPVYQQMDNSGVVPYLVAAIQELSAQVTTLQAQVTALQPKS
jgi:hypothetical protein